MLVTDDVVCIFSRDVTCYVVLHSSRLYSETEVVILAFISMLFGTFSLVAVLYSSDYIVRYSRCYAVIDIIDYPALALVSMLLGTLGVILFLLSSLHYAELFLSSWS